MHPTWEREITKAYPASAASISISGEIRDVQGWLQKQAINHGLGYLLAHADDGVNWGRIEAGKLTTSYEALQACDVTQYDHRTRAEIEAVRSTCLPLRAATLQQARLFGKGAELLLWRDGDNKFHARLLRDEADAKKAAWVEAFDEPQILWGTHGISLGNDFTLLRDGAQGLRHAVPEPLKLTDDGKLTTPAKILVRHYLAKEVFARVVVSRLVRLEVEKVK